jgi:hypothetical protein
VTALVLAAAVALLGVLAPAASANVETATSGPVQAQLSYTKNGDFDYSNVRIEFTRGGTVVTDEPVPPPCPDCQPMPAGRGDSSSLTLRDVGGNGEPEAIVDLFTGGAHCCLVSVIYRYDAASNTYKHILHDWADADYLVGDFNGDGRVEFRSSDARFAFRFTAYVFSGFPIQIWRYQTGRMIDVTRSFPRLVRKDAKQELKFYRDARHQKLDVRGYLAAFLADEYLLGKGTDGWKVVNAAYHRGELHGPQGDTLPKGKRYLRELRRFLKNLGYIR